MSTPHRVRAIKESMNRLRAILAAEGETNWVAGVNAALESLDDAESRGGFEAARRIYGTMIQGGGGFSEYYIAREDPQEQAAANEELDRIRDAIWRAFQELGESER